MRAILRWGLLTLMLFPMAVAHADDAGPIPPVAERITTHRYLHRVAEDQIESNQRLPIVVQGRVRAVDSGLPLAYTNLFVEERDYGTMAMSSGQYWLRGLPPGRHQLRAKYLSYEDGEYELDLRPGDIVELNFWLKVDPLRLQTILVKAERLLLNVQETGTARRLSGDQIEALALDGLVELVGLQAGVTLEDNELHVRGGRADDTAFLLDGLSVKDPLSAGRYGAGVNEDLINEIEVLTGGFSAEYGQAVSGLVNVSTKEGGDDWHGKLTFKTDEFAPQGMDHETDDLRFTLSGPNPLWNGLKGIGIPLPGEQSFIASFSGKISDTHLPTNSLSGPLQSPLVGGDFWSPRAQNDFSGLAKLTWKLDPLRKFNFLYNYQQDISLGFFLPSEGYPNKFQNILDNYDVFTSRNILTQTTWRHVLGEEAFYTLNFGRQFSRLHSNRNGEDDFSEYRGPTFNVIEVPDGSSYIEGAFLGGDNDRWHDHYTESWTAKGDLAWRWGENHRFKMGLEYSWSELQLVDLKGSLGSPPPGFLARSQDIFQVHPQVGAAYLQDQLTYNGLILNLGARLDAWAPGREVDRVMANNKDYLFVFEEMADDYYSKTTEAFGLNYKARVSPRVGVSFPVSTKDKVFFNYGHFSQWPRYNYVYAQLETDFATSLALLGNPDLDPKVTVQYEAGLQHEFDNLWSAGLTFYSNDIYGYAQSVVLEQITIDPSQTPDPDDQVSATVQPVRYFNADAARSLGIEMMLEKRTTRWLSGTATLEFQRATGTNSDANRTFLSAQLEQGNSDFQTERGIRSLPLLWDRPWSVTFNLDFRVGNRDRPHFLGWHMPPNWSANLLFRAWAGIRYTELDLRPDGSTQQSPNTYGKLGPHRQAIDLKMNRWWPLGGGRKLTAFLEARNIFDHENWRRVNPWTGEAYRRGNWDGSVAGNRLNGSQRHVNSEFYVEDSVNPSYRTEPRTFLMGMSVQW